MQNFMENLIRVCTREFAADEKTVDASKITLSVSKVSSDVTEMANYGHGLWKEGTDEVNGENVKDVVKPGVALSMKLLPSSWAPGSFCV